MAVFGSRGMAFPTGRIRLRQNSLAEASSEFVLVAHKPQSWLLVVKAFTILSLESSNQPDASANFWGLLGEICRCIDRHILAETLQPSAYDTAELSLDCLSSLLKLAKVSKAYRHESGTWNELLQIAYRLYLLDIASIDRQLVTYVATLAVYARDEPETAERQAQLQACGQIALLICDRNSREGAEA